jgi:ferredoxin-NADP reductase
MSYLTNATVTKIIKHSENIHEYELKLDKPRKYNPGSFVQFTLDIVNMSERWPDSRTFSIASYRDGFMSFIIKRQGYYTSKIFEDLSIGSSCTIKYPFGELFNPEKSNEKHLFIASGVGISPFLGLIQYFESLNKLDNVSMFYSAKQEKDILYKAMLQNKLGNRIKFFITREKCDDKFINRRIVISDIIIYDLNTNIYLCGSKEFSKSLKQLLLNNGFKNIYMDEWE